MSLGLPPAEIAKTNTNVINFFERFPEALRKYSAADLFHFTHSMNLADIQAEGLRTNTTLFPPEHGKFLLDIAARSSGDTTYIQDRIITQRGVYATLDPTTVFYAMPERIMLLCRGLHACSVNRNLSQQAKTYAGEAFEFNRSRLLDSNPQTVTLRISPLAPAILNARLGNVPFATIEGEEDALFYVKYSDAYPHNIEIPTSIASEYISIDAQRPLDIATSIGQLTTSVSWLDNGR